jgi:hypothetical protein
MCGVLDGSVKPVLGSVSADTFWRACKPDDNIPLGGDWN